MPEKGQMQKTSADIFQPRLPSPCSELRLVIVRLLQAPWILFQTVALEMFYVV